MESGRRRFKFRTGSKVTFSNNNIIQGLLESALHRSPLAHYKETIQIQNIKLNSEDMHNQSLKIGEQSIFSAKMQL